MRLQALPFTLSPQWWYIEALVERRVYRAKKLPYYGIAYIPVKGEQHEQDCS